MTIEKWLEKTYPHLEDLANRIHTHDEALIMEYLKSKEKNEGENDSDFWYRKYKAIKDLALFHRALNHAGSCDFWTAKLENLGGSICPYCRIPVSLYELICSECFAERQGSS